MCVCKHVCMCVGAHVCAGGACMCGGLRLMSIIALQFIDLDRVVSLNVNLPLLALSTLFLPLE